MTKKTRASLHHDTDSNLPDNNQELITPANARAVFANVIDSMRMDEDTPSAPSAATSNMLGVFDGVADLPKESIPNLFCIARENAIEKIYRTDKDGKWQLYTDLSQDSNYLGLFDSKASLPAGVNAQYAFVNDGGVTLYVNISGLWTSVSSSDAAIKKLTNDVHQLAGTKADSIIGNYDPDNEVLTLKLLSGSTIIDTQTVSFDAAPVPVGDIYYGFSDTSTINEVSIKAGTNDEVPHLKGHKIHMTRATTGAAYMWVWIDDNVGAIKGFNFSGFLSVWQSMAVTVDGVAGKVYISPNTTNSQDVTFEVEQ